MSDWEDDVPSPQYSRDFNSRNEWNGRDQSSDRHGPTQSNDQRRNDRFDGGEAISFEIDQKHVGMVIGRGGCKIKEIQEKYNVNLNIGKFRNHR